MIPSMPDDKWMQDMMHHFGFNNPGNAADSLRNGTFPGMMSPGDHFDFSAFDKQMARQMQEMEKYMRAMMQQHMDSTYSNQPQIISPQQGPPRQQEKEVQPEQKPKTSPVTRKDILEI